MKEKQAKKSDKKRGGNMKLVRQKEKLSNKKRNKNTEGARESQTEREELESKRKNQKRERDLLHDVAKEQF